MDTRLKFWRFMVVGILLLTFEAGRSFGFGPVGHETVAYIAEDRLSPTVLKRVNDILGHDDDLASVANWADAIRTFQEETKPWHFIDLPIRQVVTADQVTTFCSNNDCVIAQIQINKGVLTNPTSSAKEKLRALKFIVHFVGDLHQPLHTSDDSDQGGNEKEIRFLKRKMKLHGLWDALVEKKATEESRDLATTLENGITSAKAKVWMEGDETSWALEGYQIAKGTIYKNYAAGPQDLTQTNLTNTYYIQMRPIVDEQLRKAGVRLAKILEEIFGGP